jgi:hypothetical protein
MLQAGSRMSLSAVVAIVSLTSAQNVRAEWLEQNVPTAAAMYIACDGFLSRNRFAETDAVTCSLAMSSKAQEAAIVGGKHLCAPSELTPEMKAYAYVVEYLRRAHRNGELTFAGKSWTTLALDAWQAKWPCP